MLSDRHAPGTARAPVTILNDVAASPAGLNANAKAGEGAVPDDDVVRPGHNPLDYRLAKLLLGHIKRNCTGLSVRRREASVHET